MRLLRCMGAAFVVVFLSAGLGWPGSAAPDERIREWLGLYDRAFTSKNLDGLANLVFFHLRPLPTLLGDGRVAYVLSDVRVRARRGDKDVDMHGMETLVLERDNKPAGRSSTPIQARPGPFRSRIPRMASEAGAGTELPWATVVRAQAGHPPWRHRHTSPEGAVIKAALVLAVLLGGAVFAAVNAWRRWRRNGQPKSGLGRGGPRRRPRKGK